MVLSKYQIFMCGLFRLNQDSFRCSIFQSAWVKKILLLFETNLLASFHFREYDMYKWWHWTLLVKPFRFHFPRRKSCTKKNGMWFSGYVLELKKQTKCEGGLVKVKMYTYKKMMEARIFTFFRDAWQEGWFQNPNVSFIM